MSGIVTTSDAFKEETILKWLQEQDRLLTFQKTLEPCFALKPKQYSWPGLHHLLFSKTFVTNGAPLSLELIAGAGNTTSTS
jgi:hypothetical protein